jgi:hypothetical protein
MRNTQTRGTKKKLLIYYIGLREFYGSVNKNYPLFYAVYSVYVLAPIVERQNKANVSLTGLFSF